MLTFKLIFSFFGREIGPVRPSCAGVSPGQGCSALFYLFPSVLALKLLFVLVQTTALCVLTGLYHASMRLVLLLVFYLFYFTSSSHFLLSFLF